MWHLLAAADRICYRGHAGDTNAFQSPVLPNNYDLHTSLHPLSLTVTVLSPEPSGSPEEVELGHRGADTWRQAWELVGSPPLHLGLGLRGN